MKTKTRKPSDTGLAIVAIQNKLPKARCLYSSATGATEVHNFSYATRLGLWGPGTAFPTAHKFVEEIEAGGVAAMELVARDLKSQGSYIARALSFHGVNYERLDHILTDDQRQMYDRLCDGWQIVYRNFNAALEITATRMNKDGERKVDPKARGRAMAQFYGAQLRFWGFILTSLSLPTVIKDIEEQLAAGHCCVLQLVNTNEAAMNRQLATLDEEDDLDGIDITPRDQLMQLVEHCFPTAQQEEYESETGAKGMRPVKDSKGNIVQNKQAVKMKEKLLDDLASIKCVDGPLEQIISYFGPDKVAEVTGRSRRVVRVNGQVEIQPRSRSKCMVEAQEFQDDKRHILIFSDAGGTGASYHASVRAKNQRRRIHYLLQPGWVADQAVQGFGRTHRSDQVCAPLYKLVSTDLKGQSRFISSIARRLDQLGALTKGERKSAKNELFSRETDNLESHYAREAMLQLFKDVHAGRIRNLSLEEFQGYTGLKLEKDDGGLRESLPESSQFLNRLLSIQIDKQNEIFSMFIDRLEDRIRYHTENGSLDVGLETVRADRITKKSERDIYRDPKSGAITKIVELELAWVTDPVTWDDLQAGKRFHGRSVEFFARNIRSGHLWAFLPAQERTDQKSGRTEKNYRQVGILPNQTHFVPASELFYSGKWNVYRDDEMDGIRDEWDGMVKAAPEYEIVITHVVSGLSLPIWDRLKGELKVRRFQVTDTGERILGRIIHPDCVRETLENFGIDSDPTAYTPEEILDILDDGKSSVRLVNDWYFKQKRFDYEYRIELFGPNYADMNWLRSAGVIYERKNYAPHYLLPDSDKAIDVLAEIIRLKPVASVNKE